MLETIQHGNVLLVKELSPTELSALVADGMKRALAEHEAAKQDNEALLSTAEACALLGVCKQTLWGWRVGGKVPSRKVGQKVYYLKSELLAALETGGRGKGRRNAATTVVEKEGGKR